MNIADQVDEYLDGMTDELIIGSAIKNQVILDIH
jgi:hypothetical protein